MKIYPQVLIMVICTLSPCTADQRIGLKTKHTLHEFVSSLSIPYMLTPTIVYSSIPENFIPSDNVLIDPDTGIPEIQLSSLLHPANIFYLTDTTIDSIKNNDFVLSQDVQYTLLYKVGLLKVANDKFAIRGRSYIQLSIMLWGISLSMALFASIAHYEHIAWSCSKCATNCALLSALSYIFYKAIQKAIDPHKDLLDTIEKAHEYAQSMC